MPHEHPGRDGRWPHLLPPSSSRWGSWQLPWRLGKSSDGRAVTSTPRWERSRSTWTVESSARRPRRTLCCDFPSHRDGPTTSLGRPDRRDGGGRCSSLLPACWPGGIRPFHGAERSAGVAGSSHGPANVAIRHRAPRPNASRTAYPLRPSGVIRRSPHRTACASWFSFSGRSRRGCFQFRTEAPRRER